MFKHIIATLGVACLLSATIQTWAAPNSIELPEETARLKPSTHPGYQIAIQRCSICHSADYITLQPPGMSLKQWTAEAGKMQHAFGAPITDDEVKLIGEYLAETYGKP